MVKFFRCNKTKMLASPSVLRFSLLQHFLILCQKLRNIQQINFEMVPSFNPKYFYPKAILQRCSVKKVFLEISQNLQENASEF